MAGRERRRADRNRSRAPKRALSETLRLRVVGLHLAGLTGRAIAGRLGVHEDSVSDWLQEPWVKAQVEAGRRETVAAVVEAAKDFARAHTLEALETLARLMRDPRVQDSTRRLSAEAILDRGGVEGGSRVEHAGKIEGGEAMPDLSRLSTEELLAWKALRQKARGV